MATEVSLSIWKMLKKGSENKEQTNFSNLLPSKDHFKSMSITGLAPQSVRLHLSELPLI